MNKYIREPGNFITHFLPAVLALPGMYLLLQKSSTLFEETAAIVYGLGIFVLFSVSAIYHSVPKNRIRH
ncbi:MAG: hemolysin III family protein [Pedobacter sp.]|nr:hemolysin III family protein [Pedobacter sp.]MDQ8004501.1 hemolysin III family protein [Pedobacter sp.]